MPRRLLASLLIAAVAGVSATTALADLIQLKDGRTLSGTIARDGDNMVIHTDSASGAKVITTTSDQIVRITLTNSLTPAQLADTEWNRVALQIKKADDLATIISLHQKFIDKFPNEQMTAGVRTSLGEYQKLERQKAVKFRGRWMPSDQVEVTLRTWQDNARPAVELYRSGHVREAFDSVKTILRADSENPIALTTAGLCAFRLNDIAASKQYFTKLAAADPSSPLAENNLGVIATQQRNLAQSLIHYTHALQSSPGNRLLLDNIEEAVASYIAGGGDQKNAVFKDLQRQFEQAEARMEADLAKKDLYRYGSTWVSKDELTRLTATHESIQAAMKDLDTQYAAARQQLSAINDQIALANTDYNNTLASVNSLNSIVNGSNAAGLDISSSLARRDALMTDLQTIRNRKIALESQRDQLNVTFGNMFSQADKLKTAMAGAQDAQYTGLQRMMELGEDLSPPPPSPLPAPRVVLNLPAPQAPAPAPAVNPQQYDDDVADNYRLISTPMGFPLFPVPPRRDIRGNHDGHDGNHDGGHNGHDGNGHDGHHEDNHQNNAVPATPGVYPAPTTSNPARPGPVTPPPANPGNAVGNPGNNSVTPAPRTPTPTSTPAATPAPRQSPTQSDPDDSPKAPRNPWSNAPN